VMTGPIIYDGRDGHGRERLNVTAQFGEARGGNVVHEPMLSDPMSCSVDHTFNSEMELLAPAPAVGACSLQELNIAIQGVMQTIEEERAVRANETSDLRRELYQAIHQGRDVHSREFEELKNEVSTQHGWFMKEIIRRSVYEARLQNEVDQVCKDPQETADRLTRIDRDLAELRAAMEPLREATEKILSQVNEVAHPELSSDPRLVELLVASSESTVERIESQLHDLVRQKIEDHLGKVDDSGSLFGMVKESLTTSRRLQDEFHQVKEKMGPIPSMPVLEPMAASDRELSGQLGSPVQDSPAEGNLLRNAIRREGRF